MWHKLFVLVCLLHTTTVLSQWTCTQDSDCSDLLSSVCTNGVCGCPTGQQIALAGTACVDLAPYHTSTCVEDHQCSRLFTMFECRRENETIAEGTCLCQEGYHYFLGRCWPTVDYGGACASNEQCLGTPRNPYSLQCSDNVCVCAEGYYERQRGECRKIGYAVGDGCVVDEDCRFTNGVCEVESRRCIDSTAQSATSASAVNKTPVPSAANKTVTLTAVSVRSHGIACSMTSPCEAPFECSNFGACVCPVGYYLSDNGLMCNAELGSRSTAEQCVGLLAEVIDGICTCPANFFFEENMRDCIKVTRRITDSCVTDVNCHTFGPAARCGPASGPWEMRTCECDPERSVWDGERDMCRLFVGIGEQCEVDSDCLAGELEIQCVAGQCTCPEGLVPADGLCLTTGLALNDTCQSTVECTETPNTVCTDNRCSCGEGYQELDNFCAAIIGGSCATDADCVVEHTACANDTLTCQCRGGFAPYDDVCWPVSTGYQSNCTVDVQCTSTLGDSSECVDGACACTAGHHHRDGTCWGITVLFEPCTRTSECYLPSSPERAVCRNSVCQCDFDYPYSEELGTCMSASSASTILGSVTAIVLSLTYLILS